MINSLLNYLDKSVCEVTSSFNNSLTDSADDAVQIGAIGAANDVVGCKITAMVCNVDIAKVVGGTDLSEDRLTSLAMKHQSPSLRDLLTARQIILS